MTVDAVEIDTVNFDSYKDVKDAETPLIYSGFHEKVSPLGPSSSSWVGSVSRHHDLSTTDWKVANMSGFAARGVKGDSRDVKGEVKIGVDMSWGGNEGVKGKVHADAKVKDEKNGGSLEFEASQDFGGEGHANVSAGYERD